MIYKEENEPSTPIAKDSDSSGDDYINLTPRDNKVNDDFNEESKGEGFQIND